MADTDNNPKTVPPEGQTDNKAVNEKPADIDTPSLSEAKAVLEAPEGHIEEAIEKERFKKDKEIAPDLIKLKKEQDKVKDEVKQKKVEAKEATKDVKEKEKVIPSKFENKTPEERLKIYQDMESSFTKKSQKVVELEAKVAELTEIDKKIAEMEKNSVINQQKAAKVKLPEYPPDDLYYEDPVKYNKQVKAYNDAKMSAMVTPLYGQNWDSQKKDAINKLKEATQKDIVPYKDIENDVEKRLRNNPALINQYGLNAREYVYGQIRNEMLPLKIDDIRNTAKEEAKRELQEEKQEMNDGQIMSSDITTKTREAKPVDLTQRLESGEEPEKIINAYKKKYHVNREI